MEDRELLELAAKAAGLKINARMQALRDKLIAPETAALWIDTTSTAWNPLTDDAHAMRLAVKLNMQVAIGDTSHPTSSSDAVLPTGEHATEPHHGDPYAATRRSIVRAAAEIAKDTK